MKNAKQMKYGELEQEVILNHREMRTVTLERKRELILRNHELMTEMDSRWNRK